MFIKPISYKKIKILITFQLYDYKEIDGPNHLLSTKSTNIIGIDGINIASGNKIQFNTTAKVYNGSDNKITDEIKFNVNEVLYDIETKYIYNEDKSPIVLEWLGNTLDFRTFEEKRGDDLDNKRGANLQELLNRHSFKGFLYELRILK